jgi:hypothetical protein
MWRNGTTVFDPVIVQLSQIHVAPFFMVRIHVVVVVCVVVQGNMGIY